MEAKSETKSETKPEPKPATPSAMFAVRKLSDTEWICEHVLPACPAVWLIPRIPHESGYVRVCRACYLEYRTITNADDIASLLGGVKRIIGHLHEQHDRIDKLDTLLGMYSKNTENLRVIINSILRRERDRDIIALD